MKILSMPKSETRPHMISGKITDAYASTSYADYDGTHYSYDNVDVGFVIPDVAQFQYLNSYAWRMTFNYDGTINFSDLTTQSFSAGVPITKTSNASGLTFNVIAN